MTVATVAAVVGVGAGGLSIYNSLKKKGGGNGSTYVPTGLDTADQQFQDILGMLGGNVGEANQQISPELAKAFQAILNSGAGQKYNNLADQAGQASGYLNQSGMNLGNAGQQLWNTALDPQNEMRDVMQQRTVDAARAGDSARGIAMSPESAGVENKAVGDFLRNWNFDQLQRQATGLQGYTNAANQSGRNIAGGLAAGQLQPEYMMQGAGVPFQAAGMYGGALSGLNSQLGGFLSQIIPYLNQGLGATGQNFMQGQVGLNNFTTGLNQLGKSGGGGGSMDWLTNAFSGPMSPGSGDSPAYGGDNAYVPYGGGP